MAYIEITPPERATGLLRQLYDAAVSRAGKVFQILRLHNRNRHRSLLQSGLAFGRGDDDLFDHEIVILGHRRRDRHSRSEHHEGAGKRIDLHMYSPLDDR